MLPNGSGGTGRLFHSTGRLSLSREADETSSHTANRRTRRAGNGISFVIGRVYGNCKRAAASFRCRLVLDDGLRRVDWA